MGVVTGDRDTQQRTFDYPFSLSFYDVLLRLCRNAKNAAGEMVEGEQHLGALFGFRKKEVKAGAAEPPNDFAAITCTTHIEFWDVNANKWVHASRVPSKRFAAGGSCYGRTEALDFGEFKKIIGP